MLLLVLCPGTPGGSTGNGSGFKASQKTGQMACSLIRQTGSCFCGRVPWLYQYWPGGFVFTVVLCPGTPEGSTGSGYGFVLFFVALRPMSTAMVIAGRSVHLATLFPGQA